MHGRQRNLKNTMNQITDINTASASKLIEKCFLDWRNLFSNQEGIRIFFLKMRKINSLRNIFLSILHISQNKTNFLLY